MRQASPPIQAHPVAAVSWPSQAERRATAILWLVVLLTLLQWTVAAYRVHALAPPLTDLLAIVLSRGEIALLALWFAAGRESWWLRASAAVIGLATLFFFYTRWLLPLGLQLPLAAWWNHFEWSCFFHASGPGGMVAEGLLLFALLAAPIAAWRCGRWLATQGGPASGKAWQWRLGDLLLVSFAVATCLGVYRGAAPYENWWDELLLHSRRHIADSNWLLRESLAPAVAHAAAAAVALVLAIRDNAPRRGRELAWLILASCAIGFATEAATAGGDPVAAFGLAEYYRPWRAPEWLICPLLSLVVYGGVRLVRCYENARGPVRERHAMPGELL